MDEKTPKILIERMNELMKQRYISKKEMAERLEMEYLTFWRKLNGKRSVDANLLKRIAEVLGTSVAYLMGETDNPVIGLNDAPELTQAENQMTPQDIFYWSNFLENVQKIATGGNMAEISSVKSFLKSAFSLLAIGEAQALHVADTKVNTEKNRSMSVTQHHNQNAMVTVDKSYC